LINQDTIFFFNLGCPGQLTRTTTKSQIHWTPCKPSRQVRHREGDRCACWGSNPDDRGKKTLPLPLGQKPRCTIIYLYKTRSDIKGQFNDSTRSPLSYLILTIRDKQTRHSHVPIFFNVFFHITSPRTLSLLSGNLYERIF
jgi:hypothetical protein